MLRRLSVENYVLIDKLEMELDPHLNIITGETGAGKSILLGALGLLLGAKNDGQAMKDATRNCTVEGTFDLAGSSLEAFFAENDLDYAPETTLTRMITPAGKSRAFVNDVPVQLAQLRELGARLLDIHSQHQNLILSSEEFRTSALDTVAANGELLTQYAAQYARLTELRRRLAALREEAANGRRDEEWLRFQTEELTSANLRPGEQAELEEELAVLENADRIGEALGDERARRFHVHFSKIEYTAGGEKQHLTFADTVYGPAFEPLMELFYERGLEPVVICESAGTQAEDAAAMKRYYRELG